MGLIGMVLLGFGFASLLIAQQMFMASVDRDLALRASEIPKEFHGAVRPGSILAIDSRRPGKNAKVSPLLQPSSASVDGRMVDAWVMDDSGQVVVTSPEASVEGTRQESLGKLAIELPEVRSALGRGKGAYGEVLFQRRRFRVFATPLSSEGPQGTQLVISYPVEELYNLLATLRNVLLILLPIALGVTYIAGQSMTRRALEPVREIARAASAAGAHDLSKRFPVAGDNEFSDLACTFNEMFDRLQTSFDQLEGLVAQQKQFVGDASHELRTPLTVVRGSASWALQKPRSNAEYQEALEGVNEAAARMERLVSNLLCLAKADANKLGMTWSTVSAVDLLKLVVHQFNGETELPHIAVRSEPTITFRVDRDKMLQILSNLLENAIRWTPSSGQIEVSAVETEKEVEIVVNDTGAGIPEEDLPHVFDRFFRVDLARSSDTGGTGLGLAICRELVQAHEGSISIVSALNVGTKVVVRIPKTLGA